MKIQYNDLGYNDRGYNEQYIFEVFDPKVYITTWIVTVIPNIFCWSLRVEFDCILNKH